jgi:hypothetical protein
MSYKLYTDKPNKFSCNIEVDGTSLSKSKARIIIECNDINYMFNGKIDDEGNCEITIPKTKNFLSENNSGKMRLEVIADDVYFEPWSSDFIVKASKNVQVIVKEQVEEEKTKLKVNVAPQKEEPIKNRIIENKFLDEKSADDEIFLTKDQLSKLLRKG